MPIEVRLATTDSDLQKIYELRYKVYIEEMGRSQDYADHASKQICEPYDEGATIFGAFDGDRCVGTIRGNLTARSYMGDYPSFYGMQFLTKYHPKNTSMTTKLMVDPDYRNTTAAVRLAQAMYVVYATEGVLFDFIDTCDHLLDMYHRLGYREYMGKVYHHEYGWVTPMVLVIGDESHMQSVRSPLYRMSREIDDKLGVSYYQSASAQQSVSFFHKVTGRADSGECTGSCGNSGCPILQLLAARRLAQSELALAS